MNHPTEVCGSGLLAELQIMSITAYNLLTEAITLELVVGGVIVLVCLCCTDSSHKVSVLLL